MFNHHNFRNGMFNRLMALLFIAMALTLLPRIATAQKMSNVAFLCQGAPAVSQAQTVMICAEFSAVLRSTYPAHQFRNNSKGRPLIHLIVTRSNERSVGLEVSWIDAKGRKTKGVPLQTSFFDRNADPILRKRFFEKFLQHNPLPF